ncbi:MAG: hypothetical protein ACLVJV_13720 [Oscillospiraceae bacterium]|jgi:hypothetical protein
MTQYLYPQNLKATANLWLWSLRDFAILCIAVLLSALALVQLGMFIPAAVTLCFGFLTIRMDDTTVLDYMRYAVRYLISTQQYFEWAA